MLPNLGLLVSSGGLGVIFTRIGRWRYLTGSVPEFIALSLAAGILYVAAFVLSSYLSWVSTIARYKSLYGGFGLTALGVLAALLLVSKQPLHGLITYAWNPCELIPFAMSTNYMYFQ